MLVKVYVTVSREDNLDPEIVGHPEKFMPFSKAIAPLAVSFTLVSSVIPYLLHSFRV